MKRPGILMLMALGTILFFLSSAPAQALERLGLDKPFYEPGEFMEITCYGISEAEAEARCWAAVAKADAPADSYLNWNYVTPGNNTIILEAPGTLGGPYEVRFFQGSDASEENLMRDKSLSFTVSYGKTVDSVSSDRADYQPGQYLAVTCRGVTAKAVEHKAWVTVARQGDPASAYGDWKYVTEGDCALWLEGPDEAGDYEIRYYQASTASDENLADGLRVPFTVSGELPGNDTPFYPGRNDFDWDLLDFVPGSRFWTGTYETNYRTLYVVQNRNTITGKYPDWDNGRLDGTVVDGVLYGYWYESPSYAPPHDAGQLIFALYPDGNGFQGWWRYGNSGSWGVWSAGTLNRQTASAWAEAEVYAADGRRLIPDCLRDADLTQPITAAEFSALAVRLFEEIWQTQELREETPYDNIDGHPLQSEIEKAWGLGFLEPIKSDTFDPDAGFSRELLARMFCNLIKSCELDGVNPETVDNFFLPYTVTGRFSDDAEISEASRDSVYYLTSNGLMDGASESRFDPAGPATREQAIVVAERIYLMENER